MASVFVLLEAFNRKEAAALGFFPCATASSLRYVKRLFKHYTNPEIIPAVNPRIGAAFFSVVSMEMVVY